MVHTRFFCALSSPQFEVWFLWHLTDYQTTGCLGQDVDRAIAKWCPEYAKGARIPTKPLEGRYGDAARHAGDARAAHLRAQRTFPEDRPMSDIDRLMASILAAWLEFRGYPSDSPVPL